MIDEKYLIDEIESLRVTITGIPMTKELKEYVKHFKRGVIEIIEEQPKVEWIPCSERLPEEFEYVLIQNPIGVMSVATRVEDKWYNFQGTELWVAVAWCELPEPYKEKKDD